MAKNVAEIRAAQIESAKKLRNWNELTEEVMVSSAIAAALVTQRGSLVKLITPTDLPKEEVAKLYHLIGVLIETNFALQQHSKLVAEMADQIYGQFKGVTTSLLRLDEIANFGNATDEQED